MDSKKTIDMFAEGCVFDNFGDVFQLPLPFFTFYSAYRNWFARSKNGFSH